MNNDTYVHFTSLKHAHIIAESLVLIASSYTYQEGYVYAVSTTHGEYIPEIQTKGNLHGRVPACERTHAVLFTTTYTPMHEWEQEESIFFAPCITHLGDPYHPLTDAMVITRGEARSLLAPTSVAWDLRD